MVKFEIQTNDEQQTLFKFIKKSFSTTPLSVIYKWFRKGMIKVNGQKIKDKKLILKTRDIVEIFDLNQPVKREHFKYLMQPNLTIVYEDQNILIVNKPANLEVHAVTKVGLDDLVKSYLVNTDQYHPELENSFVVSHVHRLDKLTQGLIIYAKNKPALNLLLKSHDLIKKYYVALVPQKNWPGDFQADGWLKYDSQQQRSLFSPEFQTGYKKAITFFRSREKIGPWLLIEAQLQTGRKHQIRATLSHFHLSIANDFRYQGLKINNECRIFLQAYKLTFQNLPAPLAYLSGKSFEIPVLEDFYLVK